MRRFVILSLVTALAACGAPAGFAQQQHHEAFTFSRAGPTGVPVGWHGGPMETLAADSTVFRSAPFAGRLHRDSTSAGEFSAFTLSIPVTFSGSTLELRGWLRTEDVENFAGLWLRQDGVHGSLQFDNMQRRRLKGTTDWTEYSIVLPLDSLARTVYLGALLRGTGTVWVDDLELLVDGQPFTAAPPRQSSFSALGTDREFDNGSRVATVPFGPVQVENVALLGKVWGFAKYHHPQIVAGQVNWDYELFRVLPAVIDAVDRAAATTAISAWLNRLGEPAPCEPCASPPRDVHLLPALDWIRDTLALGAGLSAQLEALHRNRPAARTHYYRGAMAPGNPDFSNESAYERRGAPDAGFRLLALFRFWNIVQYWFPYRDVIGEDWDGVLAEFVPVLMAAADGDEYRLAMIGLAGRINDTHANLWGDLSLRPPRGTARLPVAVRFIDDVAVVTAYLHADLGPASGLQPGDVLEQLDGVAVDSLVAAWRPYYSASNEPTRLRDIARSITLGDPGAVNIGLRRGDRRLEVTADRVLLQKLDLSRFGRHDLPGETFQLLTPEVAYLKLSSVRNADLEDYMRQAADTKVLVVDIRNYPSEFVVFTLGGRLVDGPTAFASFTVGDPTNPGAFVWQSPISLQPIPPRYTGRVVILVDETTQSQAEYTAMALRRAPGAIVAGSTTAGADGNVSPIPLPGGTTSMISGIGVFYPDRSPTQRIGIIPDLEVRPTIAGIRAGRDEVLETAVSHALGREFRLPRP